MTQLESAATGASPGKARKMLPFPPLRPFGRTGRRLRSRGVASKVWIDAVAFWGQRWTMPQTKTPAVQRATSLLHLPPLLGDLGVSLDAVLDGTGVGAGALRPDAYIPYAGYLSILERAAAVTGREDIGLLLGRRQTLASLGPLGRVMRHAATLGEALSDFASLQISNSTGGAVYLHRTGSDFALGYGVYDAENRFSPQIHDVVLAVGCNLVAELTGGAIRPDEIHSIRSAPQELQNLTGTGTALTSGCPGEPSPCRFGFPCAP